MIDRDPQPQNAGTPGEYPRALRIAISGKSGCGNTTVSRALAAALEYRVINYTFRNLAEERGIAFDQLRQMADSDESWDRYLDQKQVALAREPGCILGSRLAIWVLNDADIRIYLAASAQVRARRIHQREGGDYHQVLADTVDRDERDRARYLRVYAIDNNRYQFADLIIDTEQHDVEAEVAMIRDLVEARLRGG